MARPLRVQYGGLDYAAVGMVIRRLDRKLKLDKVLFRQWRRVLEKLEDQLQ